MRKYVIAVTAILRRDVDGHFITTLLFPTGMLSTI